MHWFYVNAFGPCCPLKPPVASYDKDHRGLCVFFYIGEDVVILGHINLSELCIKKFQYVYMIQLIDSYGWRRTCCLKNQLPFILCEGFFIGFTSSNETFWSWEIIALPVPSIDWFGSCQHFTINLKAVQWSLFEFWKNIAWFLPTIGFTIVLGILIRYSILVMWRKLAWHINRLFRIVF